nr:RecName: Full=Hemoglobin subunit beta-2; AltName: Full=Beta-2-globin; AltName: Full=Hemoglobin beta-2 chain; AltName: Full=Hemoglobin beta-II chain [Drymarchon melanurus erebennus]
VHWSAEEKQL